MTMGFVTGQRGMRQDCHGITLLRRGQGPMRITWAVGKQEKSGRDHRNVAGSGVRAPIMPFWGHIAALPQTACCKSRDAGAAAERWQGGFRLFLFMVC